MILPVRLIFVLLTFGMFLNGLGQNPFSLDTSQKKIVFPVSIDSEDRKTHTEKDSLGRIVSETDWYEGMRKEIEMKYKGKSDTIIYKKLVVYNDSTNWRKSFYEVNYLYTRDTIYRKSINDVYVKRKLTNRKKSEGKYFPDKKLIELIMSEDSNGDGKFDKIRKKVCNYGEHGEIYIKRYVLNKDGKFELYKTNP